MKKYVLRITCFACAFTGSTQRLSRLRVAFDLGVKITRESLERTSMRTLARRYGKTKKTIVKIIHAMTHALPDSLAIQRAFLPLWSGILVFDGKVIRVYDKLATMLKRASLSENELRWMHKMRWLCGVDHGTGDLPHYELAESESRIELVMYFKTLKQMNYPLKAVVCDGNPEIPRAARFVFGEHVVIQLCTRHFIEGLRRLILEEEDERRRAELEMLILDIQHVIEADTIEVAAAHLQKLKMTSTDIRHPLKKTFIKLFQMHREKLCAHFLHPELKLPHTTNDAENLFKQLNLRLKSLGRFFHHRYASDYLNAWALLRRFTPFTDCKGGRRYRNGKMPLELAGCNIENIDPFKLRRGHD